jgi:hypothetical protein
MQEKQGDPCTLLLVVHVDIVDVSVGHGDLLLSQRQDSGVRPASVLLCPVESSQRHHELPIKCQGY